MTSHIKRPDEDYSLCGYYDHEQGHEADDVECNCAELAEQIKDLTPMEVSLLLLEQGVSWGTFYGNDDEIDYLHGAVGEGVGLAQAIMEQRNELLKALDACRAFIMHNHGTEEFLARAAVSMASEAIAGARGEA